MCRNKQRQLFQSGLEKVLAAAGATATNTNTDRSFGDDGTTNNKRY